MQAVAEPPLTILPNPRSVTETVRGTPVAGEIERLATDILEHRFSLLRITTATGPTIEWRRDYLNRISSDAAYFRRIPYLSVAHVGDHKVIWELNRHQHLVLLAQAFLLTGREEFFREIESQVESWLLQNPFVRGIN